VVFHRSSGALGPVAVVGLVADEDAPGHEQIFRS
jgi:hypothetical protein